MHAKEQGFDTHQSFPSPLGSVLLQWLKELAHAVCSQSRIHNQKGNMSFGVSQRAFIGF